MPSIFAAPLSVNLVIPEPTVRLRPSPHPTTPSEDQFLRGTVLLTLTKARAIANVKVRLHGVMSYRGGVDMPYEDSSDVLSKELCLGLENEVLPAGEHRLEFSIIIPADAAEYQRSPFGRVHHHVSATADARSFGGPIKSNYVPVFLISNPALISGDFPTPYTEMLSAYHEDMGPVRIMISATHLTVASLVLFEVSLPSPPEGLVITGVKGFVTQTVEVQYRDPPKIIRPPPTSEILFSISPDFPSPRRQSTFGDRLHPVQAGETWEYRKLSRMPHDDKLRPSTLEHTKTPIRFFHSLGIAIQYRGKCGEDLVLQLAKRAHVSSCCCFLDDVLPSYSEKSHPVGTASGSHSCSKCVCTSSFSELLAKEPTWSFTGPEGSGSGAGGWVLGVDPATKTPAGGVGTGPRREEI